MTKDLGLGIIAHDWIERHGGAEEVLKELCVVFPQAPVYTLWANPENVPKNAQVITSWMQREVFRKSRALLVPLMPITWQAFRVKTLKPDWILSSTHLFSHFMRDRISKNVEIPKMLYVHTPARYLWAPEIDPRGRTFIAKIAGPLLRTIDKNQAKKSRAIAANSLFIQQRIALCWNLPSIVIYPPVDTQFFGKFHAKSLLELENITGIQDTFVLTASRFVSYKKLHMVIEATATLGRKLVVAGGGPEEQNLRSLARNLGADVEFVINPSREVLAALYAQASVFVFPAVEDFGIMPVEAMSTGTPVVVNQVGGSRESILIGETGFTFDENNQDTLAVAIRNAERCDPKLCAEQALQFSKENFRQAIEAWVQSEIFEAKKTI